MLWYGEKSKAWQACCAKLWSLRYDWKIALQRWGLANGQLALLAIAVAHK